MSTIRGIHNLPSTLHFGLAKPILKKRWDGWLPSSVCFEKIERWRGVVAFYERDVTVGLPPPENVFWTYLDHLVDQRDHFCQKILLQVSSLPKSPASVISRKSVSRGGDSKSDFFVKSSFWATKWSQELQNIFPDVSSAPQKDLVTTPADFEIVTNFRDFDPPHRHFGKESPSGAKNRVEKINFWWFSKSHQVVTKPFWDRTNIGLMFLSPGFDYGIDMLKFEKSNFLAAWVILGDFSPPENDIFCGKDHE